MEWQANMTDITKTVSHLIESQFPGYYRESGAELVAFIKAYYEFLESTDKYSVKLSKQMFDIADIDDSLDSFISHFQNTYLADFPNIITTDKRFAIKHILDLYSSKGSKNSLELLMKLLYNEEVDVYYPADDILKPSASLWIRPQYLEVTKTPRSRTMLNQQVTGSKSGAQAFVESVVTKRVDGKLIDIIYLSSIRGEFVYGDRITDNGILDGAPVVVGSLTSLNLTQGGRNNKVGDVLDVVTSQAKHGKVRVTKVEDFTGKVDFNIEDGGYGYTSAVMPGTSAFVANTTKVYVSTAMLNVNNTTNDFILYEPVLQRIEKVYLGSATNINSNTTLVGRYLVGVDGSNNQVSNSFILAVANTNANGDVITGSSANSLVTVQLIGDTTFGDQKKLVLSSAVPLSTKEYVDEESVVVLTVTSNTGFSAGTSVYQEVRDPVANVIVSRSVGVVNTSTSTTITLEQAWGTFTANNTLYKSNNTAVNTAVSDVNVTSLGARGLVTGITGANVSVRVVYGAFTSSKKIRGVRSRSTGTISSIVDTGASTVYLSGNGSANAIVTTPSGKDAVTKVYANGIIVGQNSSTIGIYGNTYPFYHSNTGSYFIETNRELLISPPRYPNNAIIEINKQITGIQTGSGATFKVGFLENTETVALNTDIVGANNVANTPFLDILLSGANSGIGFVANVAINSGGTLYANASVTLTGGGLAGGEPFVPAVVSLVTDAGGVITNVSVDVAGSGYYTTPTLTLPGTSGTVANLTVNMSYGYGFIENPNGNSTTLIEDVLTSENFLIGSIGTLTRINPGSNYNADPFVRVYNPYIAGYARGNFYVELSSVTGSYSVGEALEQVVGVSQTAKGTVLEYNSTTNTLKVRRTSFNVAFLPGVGLTGVTSGAVGTISKVYGDSMSRVQGDDAVISANVIVANGVATAVEVIDSGFGYIRDGSVTLESANNPFVMTGTTNVEKQGIGTGYWATTTSHLNSEKKIHDNKYYQEYSYEIVSGLSLNRYKDIVQKILHVAGNEIFGTVEKRLVANLSISSANSVIEQT